MGAVDRLDGRPRRSLVLRLVRVHHNEIQTILVTASRRSHSCYFIAADRAVWNRGNPLLQVDRPRPQRFSAFPIDRFDWREHSRHPGGKAIGLRVR